VEAVARHRHDGTDRRHRPARLAFGGLEFARRKSAGAAPPAEQPRQDLAVYQTASLDFPVDTPLTLLLDRVAPRQAHLIKRLERSRLSCGGMPATVLTFGYRARANLLLAGRIGAYLCRAGIDFTSNTGRNGKRLRLPADNGLRSSVAYLPGNTTAGPALRMPCGQDTKGRPPHDANRT